MKKKKTLSYVAATPPSFGLVNCRVDPPTESKEVRLKAITGGEAMRNIPRLQETIQAIDGLNVGRSNKTEGPG